MKILRSLILLMTIVGLGGCLDNGKNSKRTDDNQLKETTSSQKENFASSKKRRSRSTNPSTSVVTKCRIELQTCSSYPSYSNRTFYDSYDGSDSDETRCLDRASEYYGWCGNSGTVIATYLEDGVEKGSKTIEVPTDSSSINIVYNDSSIDIVGTHPSDQTTWSAWANSDANSNFGFEEDYASLVNHGRSWENATIYSPDNIVSMTEAVAFAGAISSVKYNGKELIHGTHGAAFQYHLRYSDSGLGSFDADGNWEFAVDECDNPTEAGNHYNTDPSIFPTLNGSSSYLTLIGEQKSGSFDLMYSSSYPVDYFPPGTTSDDYGNGTCTNDADKPWFSGIKITKWITSGFYSSLENTQYNNVFYLVGQFDLPSAYNKKFIQVELIAYFRRWALNEYQYDAVNNQLTSSVGLTATKGGESGMGKIFANPDNSFAAGLISFNQKGASVARDIASTPYLIEGSATQPSTYSGSATTDTSPYEARYLATNWHFTYPGTQVFTHSFFVVGPLSDVKRAMRAIVNEVKHDTSTYSVDIDY